MWMLSMAINCTAKRTNEQQPGWMQITSHEAGEQKESLQTVSDSSTFATAVAPKAPTIKQKENGKDAHSISSGDQESLIDQNGFTFKKLFDDGWYVGRVVNISYSNKGEKLFSRAMRVKSCSHADTKTMIEELSIFTTWRNMCLTNKHTRLR
jgi:hypothetical protein